MAWLLQMLIWPFWMDLEFFDLTIIYLPTAAGPEEDFDFFELEKR